MGEIGLKMHFKLCCDPSLKVIQSVKKVWTEMQDTTLCQIVPHVPLLVNFISWSIIQSLLHIQTYEISLTSFTFCENT